MRAQTTVSWSVSNDSKHVAVYADDCLGKKVVRRECFFIDARAMPRFDLLLSWQHPAVVTRDAMPKPWFPVTGIYCIQARRLPG